MNGEDNTELDENDNRLINIEDLKNAHHAAKKKMELSHELGTPLDTSALVRFACFRVFKPLQAQITADRSGYSTYNSGMIFPNSKTGYAVDKHYLANHRGRSKGTQQISKLNVDDEISESRR